MFRRRQWKPPPMESVVALQETEITHADGSTEPIVVALVRHPEGHYGVCGFSRSLDLPLGSSVEFTFEPPAE